MIRYHKGACPKELTEFAATEGADWDGFSGKGTVRAALLRDQRSLCAYCQRRIVDDPTTTKVEHWIARSDPHEGAGHQLEWFNLVGVCLGVTMDERHCDTARGDRPLWLGPVEGRGRDPRRHLRYRRDGRAATHPSQREAEQDPEILNLNARFLRRNRKAILDAIEDALKRGGFKPGDLRRMLDGLDGPGPAREYVEVARDYLTRKLAALTNRDR